MRTRLPGLLGTLFLALGLAACGDGGSTPTPTPTPTTPTPTPPAPTTGAIQFRNVNQFSALDGVFIGGVGPFFIPYQGYTFTTVNPGTWHVLGRYVIPPFDIFETFVTVTAGQTAVVGF